MRRSLSLSLCVTVLYWACAWYVHTLGIDLLAMVLAIIAAHICYHGGNWPQETLIRWRWRSIFLGYVLMYLVGLHPIAYALHVDFMVGIIGITISVMGHIAHWTSDPCEDPKQPEKKPHVHG